MLRFYLAKSPVPRSLRFEHWVQQGCNTRNRQVERLLVDDDIHIRIYTRAGFSKRGIKASKRWLEARLAMAASDEERSMLRLAMRSLKGEPFRADEPKSDAEPRSWWSRWFG